MLLMLKMQDYFFLLNNELNQELSFKEGQGERRKKKNQQKSCLC